MVDRIIQWWHENYFCYSCNGNGMTGPLNDPDPCGDCGGHGHMPASDEVMREEFYLNIDRLRRKAL